MADTDPGILDLDSVFKVRSELDPDFKKISDPVFKIWSDLDPVWTSRFKIRIHILVGWESGFFFLEGRTWIREKSTRTCNISIKRE